MIERLTELLKECVIDSLAVITQYEEILWEMKKRNIKVIKNENSIQGISSSLKLGLLKAREYVEQEKDNYYIFLWRISRI